MRKPGKLVPIAAVMVLATAVGGIVAPAAPAHRGMVEIRYPETA